MGFTPGERRALFGLAVVVAGLMPPVTTWASTVEVRPFGLPFLLFWNAAMVVATALFGALALAIVDRVDGRGDR